MSFEFILRIIGMVVLGIAGGYWGFDVSRFTPDDAVRTILIFSLVGALTGLILTPYFTTRPARAIRALLGRMTAESLFAGLTGLVVGLLIAALLAFPLSMLPAPFSQILPFIGVLVFSYFGVSLFVMRQGDIMGLLSALSGRGEGGSSSSWSNLNRNILLDTSGYRCQGRSQARRADDSRHDGIRFGKTCDALQGLGPGQDGGRAA